MRGAGHEPIFSAKSEWSAFEARVETVMHEPPPGAACGDRPQRDQSLASRSIAVFKVSSFFAKQKRTTCWSNPLP